MTYVVECSFPSEGFPLASVLTLDGVDAVEFECTVPARLGTMPYFWVWGADFDRVDAALAADPSLGAVRVVDRLETAQLYRATWTEGVPELLDAVRSSEGHLRRGRGTDRWRFELGFERDDDFGAFSRRCTEANLEVTVDRIRSVVEPRDDGYGLTARQRETLLAAEACGYFEEPRAVTMAELAAELDRSSAAVSGVLRRGVSTLIRNTLETEPTE